MNRKGQFAKGIKVKGRKSADLRELATSIRNSLHLGSTLKFPVIRFLEVLQWKFDDFEIEIVEPSTLPKGMFACYNPCKGIVTIGETYYNMANEENGFARWTILHECAHYILHKNQMTALTRQTNRHHEIYEDSEWQADTLVCELLMPISLVKESMTVEEVAKCFGVSPRAAQNRLSKLYGNAEGDDVTKKINS